jgi:serine/threonine-protein phosphatase 2A regulatory subunit A
MALVDTSFDPMDLVKEDLEQPVVETAIQTIKKLPLIAKAIGPVQTRDKLIPFLIKFAGFDNKDILDRVVADEALAEIARILGKFLPLVGGAQYAYILVGLLGDFAVAQETCVREAAVESFEELVPLIRAQDVIFEFFPIWF